MIFYPGKRAGDLLESTDFPQGPDSLSSERPARRRRPGAPSPGNRGIPSGAAWRRSSSEKWAGPVGMGMHQRRHRLAAGVGVPELASQAAGSTVKASGRRAGRRPGPRAWCAACALLSGRKRSPSGHRRAAPRSPPRGALRGGGRAPRRGRPGPARGAGARTAEASRRTTTPSEATAEPLERRGQSEEPPLDEEGQRSSGDDGPGPGARRGPSGSGSRARRQSGQPRRRPTRARSHSRASPTATHGGTRDAPRPAPTSTRRGADASSSARVRRPTGRVRGGSTAVPPASRYVRAASKSGPCARESDAGAHPAPPAPPHPRRGGGSAGRSAGFCGSLSIPGPPSGATAASSRPPPAPAPAPRGPRLGRCRARCAAARRPGGGPPARAPGGRRSRASLVRTKVIGQTSRRMSSRASGVTRRSRSRRSPERVGRSGSGSAGCDRRGRGARPRPVRSADPAPAPPGARPPRRRASPAPPPWRRWGPRPRAGASP